MSINNERAREELLAAHRAHHIMSRGSDDDIINAYLAATDTAIERSMNGPAVTAQVLRVRYAVWTVAL